MDKGVNHGRILLVEGNETISDNNEISEKINSLFADVVKNLNIQQYRNASNKRRGRLLNFLRKSEGRLFEGTFNIRGPLLKKFDLRQTFCFS